MLKSSFSCAEYKEIKGLKSTHWNQILRQSRTVGVGMQDEGTMSNESNDD